MFRPALVKLAQEATSRPAHHPVRFEGSTIAADPSVKLTSAGTEEDPDVETHVSFVTVNEQSQTSSHAETTFDRALDMVRGRVVVETDTQLRHLLAALGCEQWGKLGGGGGGGGGGINHELKLVKFENRLAEPLLHDVVCHVLVEGRVDDGGVEKTGCWFVCQFSVHLAGVVYKTMLVSRGEGRGG